MIQWIKCSGRMPEDGEMVLTVFRGCVRTAVCKAVYIYGSKIFVSELNRSHGIPATHLTKSPEPPQE